MSQHQHSVIFPVSPEQRRREDELHERLRGAEEGAVRAALEAERSPDKLLSLAAQASDFAETLTAKHRHPDSPPVACQSGCSWCCYQLVRVTAPEVFRIVRYINSPELPVPREELVDRLSALNKVTRGLTPQGRTRIPKSCAFLESGQCRIYPVRPLACAEFTSYDAKACKRGQRVGFKPGLIAHEKARLLAYSAVHHGLNDGLRKALPEADTNWLELTAAVVQALAEDKPEERWLAGDDIFAGAHAGAVAK